MYLNNGHYIRSFMIVYHNHISIHLIHAENMGIFFWCFLIYSDAFGQYQSSLLLGIDNSCKGNHIWLLSHLLHLNIEGTTVDLVPKIHVVWSLRWHQVCSFLFIETTRKRYYPLGLGFVTLRLSYFRYQ